MNAEARDYGHEYQDLTGRLTDLRQRRAVLAAREEDKAREREALEADLVAAGIDVADLDGEEARLVREVGEALDAATESLDQFESELSVAETTTGPDTPGDVEIA